MIRIRCVAERITYQNPENYAKEPDPFGVIQNTEMIPQARLFDPAGSSFLCGRFHFFHLILSANLDDSRYR